MEEVKRASGVECTLFHGDKRLSSTLTLNGQSVTGTRIANPAIEDMVLRQGKDYTSTNTFNNINYDTLYWPWKDTDGKIDGMFFVGAPRTGIVNMLQQSLMILIGAALAVTAVMITVGVFSARALANPVKDITAHAQAVAGGDLNRDFDVTSKDEVGLLAKALSSMVATLKSKIAESESKSHEAEQQALKAVQAMQDADESKRRAEDGSGPFSRQPSKWKSLCNICPPQRNNSHTSAHRLGQHLRTAGSGTSSAMHESTQAVAGLAAQTQGLQALVEQLRSDNS